MNASNFISVWIKNKNKQFMTQSDNSREDKIL